MIMMEAKKYLEIFALLALLHIVKGNILRDKKMQTKRNQQQTHFAQFRKVFFLMKFISSLLSFHNAI